MSGFFKKLFNRVAGKKEEAPPPAAELDAIAAPELESEPVDPILTEEVESSERPPPLNPPHTGEGESEPHHPLAGRT